VTKKAKRKKQTKRYGGPIVLFRMIDRAELKALDRAAVKARKESRSEYIREKLGFKPREAKTTD
jgi:hypothetical protein